MPSIELRPRLALRVGFAGHRDLRGSDEAALKTQVRAVLETVRNTLSNADAGWGYSGEAPLLYMLNSLAEGADQVAAGLAVELGYRLRCPIPFAEGHYKEYFEDFVHAQAHYRERFDALSMDRNADSRLIVLHGPHATESQRRQSYRAATDLMLDHADLLIAVVDPDRPEQQAGTAESVKRAEQIDIPVVLINPRNPDAVQLAICDEDSARCLLPIEQLGAEIRRIVAPFATDAATRELQVGRAKEHSREQQQRRDQFFHEPLQNETGRMKAATRLIHAFYGLWWTGIMRAGKFAVAVSDRRAGRGPSPGGQPSRDSPPGSVEVLANLYARPQQITDALSVLYMNLYRGSFVLNFLLGALAVLFALLSYFDAGHEAWWLGAEIAALALILTNFVADRVWRWHERGIEYRFLAEHFRHMQALSPLARVTPLTRTSVYNQAGDPQPTWMNWYFRAVVRGIGVTGSGLGVGVGRLDMDDSYAESARAILCRDWLKDQAGFYRLTARRFGFITSTIGALTLVLFVVTFGACLLHLYEMTSGAAAHLPQNGPGPDGGLLIILVAALPAFLAALHGLNKQAEFERLAERYQAMGEALERIHFLFSKLPAGQDEALVVTLGGRAVDIARMMLEEVLEWRVIHLVHATELT